MPVIYRDEKGSLLTAAEVDGNFRTIVGELGNKQASSQKLSLLASSVWAADHFQYQIGEGALANSPLTAWARNLLASADSAAGKTQLDLGNVDNTPDSKKPVSEAVAQALADKQDKALKLTAIAGSVWATNQLLMASGANTLTMLASGVAGRALIAAADAEGVRTVAGINTAPFTTDTDFNNYTKKGSFILPSVADNLFSNAPPGAKAIARGLLVVDTAGPSGFTTQILTLYQSGTQYVRTTGGGAWAAWNRFTLYGDGGLLGSAPTETASSWQGCRFKAWQGNGNAADGPPAGAVAVGLDMGYAENRRAQIAIEITGAVAKLFFRGTTNNPTTTADWKQAAAMGDNGIGVPLTTAGQVIPSFTAPPSSGFWRSSFANAPGGPSDAAAGSGFACSFLPYVAGTGFYHLISPVDQWTGYFNGTTVAWTRSLKTGDYGLGDHMKFTSNMGAGRALSSIEGNGFFASSVQTPSDWKSDGGGGTYPMGFTVQATAALGLQVAAGNGSNALHYRVRGPSSFLDWRKIYDNANLIGVVSQSAGAITGAVFETGSNANGEYAKFADGTAICRLLVTTPDAPFTKLGSMYLSSPATLNLPVTLRSYNDALVQGNDLNSTSMIVTGRRVTANTCQVQCMYPDVVSSQVRSLVVVVIGRWY